MHCLIGVVTLKSKDKQWCYQQRSEFAASFRCEPMRVNMCTSALVLLINADAPTLCHTNHPNGAIKLISTLLIVGMSDKHEKVQNGIQRKNGMFGICKSTALV